MKPLRFTMLLTAALCLVGCDTTGPDAEPVVFHFDFAEGKQGWTSLFSNYYVGREEKYELEAGYRFLPEPLDTTRKALYISGTNYVDDLNMFFKRQVRGLAPNTPYRVSFMVELATNAPSECAGVGGSPGHSVTVHTAVSSREFVRIVDFDSDPPYYRLRAVVRYERNNERDWHHATEIGDVANSLSCEEGQRLDYPYRLKRIESGLGHWQVTADDEGRAWLMVGTRSGFESTTSLYYTEIVARFAPQ